MRSCGLWIALTVLLGGTNVVSAQMMRPPPFIGGIPGKAQMQSIVLQRHQARTLLYREALEELRKNPATADVPDCPPGQPPQGTLCLARPAPAVGSPTPSAEPVATLPQETATPPAPATPPLPKIATTGKIEPSFETGAPATPKIRRRIALLVGNNDYPQPIPALETPVADVTRIAADLKSSFGYETEIVRNAGKERIIAALNRIAAEATPEDSVLLFYAGHGYLMDDINMGFWIPTDASVKTAKGWISNNDISKLLSAIRARQLILISDSCFSGSLTREHKVTEASTASTDEVLKRRSVLVLSSGGDEPVSDEGKEGHSIFAWNLIKTLEASGGITPGAQVWRAVRGGVVKDYPQEPQYGAVVSAGHVEGGEYLFQRH